MSSGGYMVPKNRQTESVSTEYLRQARIVWRELISIAKRLPKSRALTETQYVCRAGLSFGDYGSNIQII